MTGEAVDTVKPMNVKLFSRLTPKARKVHWNAIPADQKRLGSSGQPEVAALTDNGSEIWIPANYCISVPFEPATLAEMIASVTTPEEATA